MFKIKGYMNRDVHTVSSKTSVLDVIEIIANNRTNSVLVVDSKKNLLGMFTELDCLPFLMNYATNKNAPIEQFMKKDIVSFSEEDSALEIAEYFLVNNSVYQVPILKKRKVVGLVGRQNIIMIILTFNLIKNKLWNKPSEL